MGEATGASGRWRAVLRVALVATATLALWARAGEPTPDASRAASSTAIVSSPASAREQTSSKPTPGAAGIVARRSKTEHAPGDKPHPITPAHERIFRENNLVGALDLAVDLEDADRIRELVARYRAEYPEDSHRLQDGYALIADCLERLDAATRERAQQFWDTEIRSQTRRYVRRYCLERDNAS